jgi:light-regulated signal transduction histidine kinase (bacteriophytochrome)
MPRRSFSLWKEAVRGTSQPWRESELDAARDLRRAIIETLAQQKSEELAKANTELMRRNEELDAFAYIASHDLKEPLRGTQAYAQFLVDDYGHLLPDEGKRKARTLIDLSKRMEELISGLLHYAQIGRIDLEMESATFESIVQSALDMVRQLVSESGVSIRLVHSPVRTVHGNLPMLREVFSNLITNAIKYNDKSMKTVDIGILDDTALPPVPKRSGDMVVYVKDNGIGISPKHQDAIFDIFRRLHSRDQYGGGIGVGLTITKKMIERHGGSIWFESEIGVGTTFFFTLPSAEAS